MQQQINFYRSEFRAKKKQFGSGPMLVVSGVFVVAMIAAALYATYELTAIKSQLKTAKGQEKAATERLENFQPNAASGSGDKSWEEQLEEAKRSLRDQQLVLTMVRDSAWGDIDGFSRHLRSLARQKTDGLWLSYIRLSALGDNTQLEGQALRAELVPLYLQGLALEEPFAAQRFNQFQIDRPEEEDGGAKQASGDLVTFSMNSDSQLLAEIIGFKSAQAQLDKMNMRERLLVVTTGLLVLGTVWYVGLMEPMLKEVKSTRNEIAATRERTESVNQSLEVKTLQASSGAIGYREQYTLVQRRLEELNEKLGGYTAELIGPGEMARVLQGMLQKQDNLRLIRIQNVAPEALTRINGDEIIFYKHGLEIEFEGGYFAALEYLEQIEDLPWRFYWQVLELEVLEYPRNRIRLEVSTLSPHMEWIGA
jgi:MSHA biogenesis protein MshJ